MVRSSGAGIILLLAVSLSGCGGSEMAEKSHDTARQTVNQRSIEEVLAAHTPEWMAIAGVIGTGIGECDGRPCIRVLVVQKSDSLTKRIPRIIEGYPVRLEESGEIKAH